MPTGIAAGCTTAGVYTFRPNRFETAYRLLLKKGNRKEWDIGVVQYLFTRFIAQVAKFPVPMILLVLVPEYLQCQLIKRLVLLGGSLTNSKKIRYLNQFCLEIKWSV